MNGQIARRTEGWRGSLQGSVLHVDVGSGALDKWQPAELVQPMCIILAIWPEGRKYTTKEGETRRVTFHYVLTPNYVGWVLTGDLEDV